jgi:uncharacterized protein YukE
VFRITKKYEGEKEMAEIYVSVEEMSAAATSCNQLAQEIAECRRKCIELNTRLQSCMKGQTAVAFDEYIQGKAAPYLNECSEMCAQTAAAITHTCTQFTEADQTLSTAFKP